MKLVEKYRPRKLKSVVGQDSVVNSLRGSLIKMREDRSGKHSSIMIHGPFGTGKTTLARIIARVLNCKELTEDGEPCGKCVSCKKLNPSADGKIKHQNVIELNMSDTRGIDDIRALKDYTRFKAMGGGWRVIILDEVHMLTKQAQNALLKPLEDSPKRVLFVLVTTDAQKLIKTITSRCKVYRLKTVERKPLATLVRRIAKKEDLDLPKKAIKQVIEGAHGHPRNALNILEAVIDYVDGSPDDGRDITELIPEAVEGVMEQSPEVVAFKFMEALIDGDLKTAFKFVAASSRADNFINNALVVMYNLSRYLVDPTLAERYYRKYLEPIADTIHKERISLDTISNVYEHFMTMYERAKNYIISDEDLLTFTVIKADAILGGVAEEGNE